MCGTRATQVYERAVSNVPPAPEKRFWQRYIFLWVKYALWEELDAGDPERAREVRLKGPPEGVSFPPFVLYL